MKGEREFGLVWRDDVVVVVLDWEMEGGERFLFLLSFRLVVVLGWGWWGRMVFLVVFIVVLIECVFIVCFDILNMFLILLFYYFFFVDGNVDVYKFFGNDEIRMKLNMMVGRNLIKEWRCDSFVVDDMCLEGWLEKVDRVKYFCDFKKDFVLVLFGEIEVLVFFFYLFVWIILVLCVFI